MRIQTHNKLIIRYCVDLDKNELDFSLPFVKFYKFIWFFPIRYIYKKNIEDLKPNNPIILKPFLRMLVDIFEGGTFDKWWWKHIRITKHKHFYKYNNGEYYLEQVKYKTCPICNVEKSSDNFTPTTLVSEGYCCYNCYPG